MFESLVKSIENTFTQFTLGRLMYITFIFLLLGGGIYIYNDSTGYTFYGRIDHQITALERLHQLEQKGIKTSNDLLPLYRKIINDLKDPNIKPFTFSTYKEEIIKTLSATVVMLGFIIYGIIGMVRGIKDSSSVFFGALMCAAAFGIPAWYMPIILNSLWVTSVLLFTIQIIFMVLLTKKYNK